MIARLRSLWIAVDASYWFWPAVLTALAAVLAIVTVAIDRAGMADALVEQDWIAAAEPDGAQNMLNVIAGSMIGVAATVFSITIAAVVYASGSYGPRLLANFMEDRGNQLSLGTFIATFTYALMVLRALRGPAPDASGLADPGFVPQLSVLVATLLAGLSIMVLVYFLHHVPASIRINQVLQGIGERLLHAIDKRFPGHFDGTEPARGRKGTAIPAGGTGYIQIIDFGELDEVAGKHGATIALALRTGDFVHAGTPLLLWDGPEADEALAHRLRGCFALGGMRTPTQDIDFLIDELVEIALRALSPGINDPFTAVTAMHWLGAATAALAACNLCSGPDAEDYDQLRVKPLPDDFDHFLERGFGSVRMAAATSPIAATIFLETLAGAAGGASPARRRLLAEEADRLLAQARLALAGPALADVERAHGRNRLPTAEAG